MQNTGQDPDEGGRKGGSASMSMGMQLTETKAAVAYWSRDTIRWGPVWSGLLVTLGIYVVLAMLGTAIGLSTYNPGAGGSTAGFIGIWMGVSMIVALFFGGWVSGREAAFLGMRQGWYQATIVWALALLAGLILTSFVSVGAASGITNMSPIIARMMPAGTAVSTSAASAAARTAASGAAYAAWLLFVAAVVQWLAAIFGGWAGARNHVMEAPVENA